MHWDIRLLVAKSLSFEHLSSTSESSSVLLPPGRPADPLGPCRTHPGQGELVGVTASGTHRLSPNGGAPRSQQPGAVIAVGCPPRRYFPLGVLDAVTSAGMILEGTPCGLSLPLPFGRPRPRPSSVHNVYCRRGAPTKNDKGNRFLSCLQSSRFLRPAKPRDKAEPSSPKGTLTPPGMGATLGV